MNIKKNIGGKLYNMGFTTGSCAAAASKAAVIGLITGKVPDFVTIDTPAGICIEIKIILSVFEKDFVQCSVIKESGDDPDVTNGIEIQSKAEYTEETGIKITGGEGIGIVTKKGLKVEVGNAAINPVPMKMIRNEILKITNKNIKITVSVPKGKKIAEKTFNPRLGIQGGISIIGTTGIVTPMSEEAWKDAILVELKVKKEAGFKSLCFVFGRTGEDFAVNTLCIPQKRIVIISNFVGYMIDAAYNMGFKNLLIVGHTGKIIKLAAGNFHTHSLLSDARMETLCTLCAILGAETHVIKQIYNCITTDAAQDVIKKYGFMNVYNMAADVAEKKCIQRGHNMNIGILFFDGNFNILSKGKHADEIINILRNDLIE